VCNAYLFQETEHQHREACERLEQEKQELQARLQEQLEAERALQLRLDALQADGDMTQKQLASLQSHIHDLQPNNVIDTKIDIDSFKSTDSTGDLSYSALQPLKAVGV
jgi:chromosome segregation ATPase